MRLSKLLADIDAKFKDCDINNVVTDSRLVRPGDLFVCLSGINYDGHDFIDEAQEKGAATIVGEHGNVIKVENSRKALSKIAANFYSNPRDKFKLIGVTGTNGKTTTTYIIKNILESAGKKVGLIGTLGTYITDKHIDSKLTTPDPMELQSLFNQMTKAKVDYVVMEVSAHAIALHKLWGIDFDMGILTNITQDHLDFFSTMENYEKTKKSFINNCCKIGLVNSDDKCGREIIINRETNTSTHIKSFGIVNPADNFVTNIHYLPSGTNYFLNIEDNLFCVNTLLCGEFNVYNALCAGAACFYLGIDIESIKEGVNMTNPVKGRFNVVRLKNGASVVIDYAHTPDGLSSILRCVRKLTQGKLFCVFGCGGNRDKSKRPIMGELATDLADFVVITSDNPRYENPDEIISDITVRIKKSNYTCITDRILAIKYVMGKLNKNDAVVLAGKGAEDYIEVRWEKIPYSDYETVKLIAQKLFDEANSCMT